MGTGRDDSHISRSGQTSGSRGEKAHDSPLTADNNGEVDPDAPLPGELDDSGCFTEGYFNRVLPPIPDWMRKPPRAKEPSLFDDE